MKKVLFISHEASRSGAPLILLNFIKWLKKNKTSISIDILVLKGGELKNEFEELADHFYEIPKPPGIIKKLIHRIFKKRGISSLNYKSVKKIEKEEYDLIYANSLLSVRFAADLENLDTRTKMIAHLHELDTVIELILPDLKEYLRVFNFIIVPANIVKQSLISNYDTPPEKIEVVREFSKVRGTKEMVNTRPKKFVVGASGTVHWRKGPDIFLLVSAYIKRNYPNYPIEFKWVGRLPKFQETILNADIRKLGISGYVNFTGEKSNPIEEYKTFDLFLLPSREDPFPLVCIEVGMLGIPIICFKGCTGTEEVLRNGGGSIVTYLSINEMAEKIIEYYQNEEYRKKQGLKGKEVFSEFTPEKISPEIFRIISIP